MRIIIPRLTGNSQTPRMQGLYHFHLSILRSVVVPIQKRNDIADKCDQQVFVLYRHTLKRGAVSGSWFHKVQREGIENECLT